MGCAVFSVYCFKWEEAWNKCIVLTPLEVPATVFKGWQRKLKIWMIKEEKNPVFVEATL